MKIYRRVKHLDTLGLRVWRSRFNHLLLIVTILSLLLYYGWERYTAQENTVKQLEQRVKVLLTRVSKADQVRDLMIRYNCHNEEIFQALMNQKFLDPYDAAKITAIESEFDPRATSSENCRGLMQISDEWHLKDPYNIKDNINFGCMLYRQYLDKYKSIDLSIQAFNMGPETLNQPPCAETIAYIERFKRL